MKKRIGYFLLIIIAIVGSRLLYGINYDLNNQTEILTNIYRYDIIGKNEFLDMKLDGNYLYYVISDIIEDKHKDNIEYIFNKFDLSNNKLVNSYHFISKDMLYPIKIIHKGNNWFLTSLYNNTYYQFNKNLELIKESKEEKEVSYTYGIYNNNHLQVLDNKIYYNNKQYDTVPITCGYNQEIIYNDNTYIRFYNYNKNIGCLYNMNTKNVYYLDYEKIDVSSMKFLEYQSSSLKYRYNNEIYYFNDITESENLKMHKNGDYLFTYDNTNNYLRIYNLDTRKIIYARILEELKNKTVSNINIDDYAYFTVKDKDNMSVYVWDYLQDNRINQTVVIKDEKEYKFENNQLITDIKNKYNINILLYDKAVKYFNDIYVIPTYDEVLINSRLNTINNLLKKLNYNYQRNINIYFEKDLVDINTENKLMIYKYSTNDNYSIITSLFNNNFEEDLSNLLKQIAE